MFITSVFIERRLTIGFVKFMNIFKLGIQRTGTGIPVQAEIDPLIDPCVAASYTFDFVSAQEFLEEGTSVEIEVAGGIGPFTWTAISPGISLAAVSTIGRFNTVTCNLVPYDEKASIQVTDSCGNAISTSIPIMQDWDCGCLSGVCATYPGLVITPSAGTDPDAIVDGDAFEVTGGLPPYRWRITGAAVDASVVGTGTIAGMYWASSSNYNMTITVIDACGRRNSITGTRYVQPAEIISGWILAPGETVEYNYGCDDDPRWSISCGEIDRRTGLIKNLDECKCNATVTVTVDTSCGDPDESTENNPGFSTLTLSGSDAPVVGDIYSVSGGVSPIIFSFDGGTIDSETGEILSITSCGGSSGNGAGGSVTASDACGQTASIDVRLPGGNWVTTNVEDFPEFNNSNQAYSVTTESTNIQYIEYYNMSTYHITKEKGPAANYNATSCSNAGLSQEFNENGFCCIPDVADVMVSMESYPDSNSYGTVLSPSFSGDDGCYAYDIPAQELNFRTFKRITREWQC